MKNDENSSKNSMKLVKGSLHNIV